MSLVVDIQKDFGSFHLNVSFESDQGVLGLLGASGCGKSMTLRCIAGIVKPDKGHIELNGRTLFDAKQRIDLPPQQRKVGFLFQNYALFPNLTVEQNILAGMCREKDKAAKQRRLKELVERFYLTGLERRRPGQLSGGQQQRVALARILAGDPEALLLDEPFSALDSYLRWQLELDLMDVLERFHKPVVLVTHSRDEVVRLCRNVCVLDRGRSEAPHSVQALFDAPATVAACLLSGCKNLSRAKAAPDGRVEALAWGVTLTCARPLPQNLTHVGVRAHFLRPVAEPGKNVIPCRVVRVIDNLFSNIVMLATPGGSEGQSLLRLELDKERWEALGHPRELLLRVEPHDLLLLTS